MLRFTFSSLRAEHPPLTRDHELLLRIVADFAIEADDLSVYTEVDLPVVELATQLQLWLDIVPRAEFVYETLESEDVGLVWMHEEPAGQWRIGSVVTGRASRHFPASDVETAVRSYVAAVIHDCRVLLGYDVARLVVPFGDVPSPSGPPVP